jgi:hypothetical protein
MCIAMTACTTSTALEPQNTTRISDAARLHFIRRSAFIGGGQTARVKINEKEVGSLGIGTHIHVDRPAGQYRVEVDHPFDFGKTELTVNITSEKEYYFKIFPAGSSVAIIGAGAVGSNRLGIAAISESEAKALINEMN